MPVVWLALGTTSIHSSIEQTGQRSIQAEGRTGLHHEGEPAPRELLTGIERQRDPTVVGSKRELRHGETQRLAAARCLAVVERELQAPHPLANTRHAVRPGRGRQGVAALDLRAVADGLLELRAVRGCETREHLEGCTEDDPKPREGGGCD